MVPCKCCSSDKLDFTTKEVNSILRDGVINVSLRYRDGYWDPIDQLTLEEAIEKVPQDYRSPLRIIQFLNKEGYNEMWTWRGLDVEKEWGDINFWVKSTDDNTIIDEVHIKDGAVTTPKIADNAVTFHKLTEDAKGVIISYGTSADIVKGYLETYRNQRGRLGLYVSDFALGNVPAINQKDNIIRAVSIVKSPSLDYVDVFILVFDGFKWSRQTYSQVGRIPGDGVVTAPKIADNAVSQEKLSKELQDNIAHKAVVLTYGKWFQEYDKIPEIIKQYKGDENKSVFIVQKDGMYFPTELIYTEGSEAIIFFQPEGTNLRKFILRATGVEEVVIYGDTVRYNNQTLTDAQKVQARQNIGALSSEDGAVQTANIKDYNVIGKKISSGAITNDKIRAGAVSIDKLNTDLQSKVSDNVKYVQQNLTKEQQLQARKNIKLPDYETFDDLRKLSTLTAKRLLYVGIDNVYPGFPISVNSSTEEIDFQGKKIYFSALNAEQIAFKGHPNCKLKNLSCVLTTADYTKDANICISKFGYVENVTVDCIVYSSEVGKEVNKTIGFLSCDHLYNCRVIGGGVLGKGGFTKGYSYCNYLNLCRYKIGGELVGAKGFDHCQFISQCYVNRQSEEVMGLGTNSNVESLIWILADGSFETFSDIDHITVGGYDTTNMFKTIGSDGGTGKTKLYAKPDDKSGMATVLLDTTPVNWAVARRTPTGTLKAKDAVEEDDTVTKKQLDTLKTEVTQHLTEDEVANLWDTTK